MAEGPNTPEDISEKLKNIKTEEDCAFLKGEHSHNFKVKFHTSEKNPLNIHCDHPCTVLEAIKSTESYKKITCADENLVIQGMKADDTVVIATHFPCICIKKGQLFTLSSNADKVEEVQGEDDRTVYSKEDYSVFYIDTEGGKNAKKRRLFNSNVVKRFDYLCVYGLKGMTVEEALRRDGRFVADLGEFWLSDNENIKQRFERVHKVDNFEGKKFRINLPQGKKKLVENPVKKPRKTANFTPAVVHDVDARTARRQSSSNVGIKEIRKLHEQSVVSVKTAMDKRGSDVNIEEIRDILRQQFKDLKQLMESRFPGETFQTALSKVDFGKTQQSFSEIHRLTKLLELGKSVCKLVHKKCQGTAFVLFNNYILTNAHLFKDCTDGENLTWDTEVYALFNCVDPEPHTNSYVYDVKKTLIDIDTELDYAILELDLDVQHRHDGQVPPGLLKVFGRKSLNGEACIIGHPGGEVKKIDPTCIIEEENRVQAVEQHLNPFRDHLLTLHSVVQLIRNQGIDKIIVRDDVITYNTFMYHGSSGSPVFDAECRVVGLHGSGFVYGFPKKDSVLEYAHPVLTIFERFVTKLKERGNEELLRQVEEEAKGNEDLVKILGMTEPMETD